jgi:hypothetical protein
MAPYKLKNEPDFLNPHNDLNKLVSEELEDIFQKRVLAKVS